MKRRLLYTAFILLALIVSQLGLIKPPAVEAASSRAVNYCKQNGPQLGRSGQVDPAQLASCEAEFDNGYSDKSVATVCPSSLNGFPTYPDSSLVNYNGTAFAACENYWLAGWQAAGRSIPAGFDGAGNKQSAPGACQVFFLGDYLGACNSGALKSKKSIDKACNTNSPTFASCKYGYASNGGNVVGNGSKATQGNSVSNSVNGSSPPTSPSCDSGSFSLNWILCPIFDGVSHATDWILTSIVEPTLKVQPICLDSSGKTCAGGKNYIFDAWSNFRVYGDVFLIVALLVIVFGESIGGGLIDAYTAKKVLPRLLAAAILINLSIYIVAALVDITNIVGGSIGQVVTAPLSGAGAFSITPGGISQAAIAGGGIVGTALGGAALAALILTSEGFVFILIVLALPALLAIIGVFVTVILRQAILLFLILISPVAFALYCLPNTERYFRRWWSTLFEMLIIYPIIVLMFAVSDILSVITGNINSNNPINIILSFILLILPLFLIPFSFRMAGNTLGTIYGAVNSARQRLNGLTERQRQTARESYGRQVVNKRNEWYNSRAANALGNVPGSRYIVGRRREAVSQQIARMKAQLAQNPNANAVEHDDSTLRAATYSDYGAAVEGVSQDLRASGFRSDLTGNDREAAILAEAQRAARSVQTSIGYGHAQAAWAAEAMVRTGTAITDIPDMARIIARASGGNRSVIANLAGNMNATTKQAGRHDLAPGFGILQELSQREAGLGVSNATMSYEEAAVEAWRSASLYQHANNKPQDIQAAISAHTTMLQQAMQTGDQGQLEQASVFFNELRQMRPNATGSVQQAIDQALDGNQVEIEGALSRLAPTPHTAGQRRTEVVYDPATGNPQIDPATQQPVRRTVRSANDETGQQRVQRLTRQYERLDPSQRET